MQNKQLWSISDTSKNHISGLMVSVLASSAVDRAYISGSGENIALILKIEWSVP